MKKSKEFHQIRQVELTTDQLLLAQACVSSALFELAKSVNNIKDSEDEADKVRLGEMNKMAEKLKLLAKAFRSAMEDIESTWGGEDDGR